MKLLKTVLIIGALSLGLCSIARAGGAAAENYFDGVYGQVEVGFGAQSNKLTYSSGGNSWSDPYGQISPQYALTLGYSKQIADLEGVHDLNLAANISYNFTNGNTGTVTQSYGGTNYYNQMNTKNILSLSIEPGYYLAEQAIAYIKLGYAQGQTNMNSTYQNEQISWGTQSGPLFGFGFKHALDALHSNMFWGLEAYQINFRSKSVSDGSGGTYTSQPTLLFGKVHLGYIF
jgi:hypothetical protein